MRDIPAPMAAALASGVTTFARCWRLERRDGVALGFTDHDEDIAFGGDLYRAASGMSASAASSALGLAAGGLDVVGALDDAALTEADLARGLYDGAEARLYLVDWRDPASRLLLFRGALGEIARERSLFTAELRSVAHALQQPQGRLYQRACDAALGDARCGIDLSLPLHRAEGVAAAVTGARGFSAAALAGRGDAFARGRLVWTSGANRGAAAEVRAQDGAAVELAETPPMAIAPGDGFTVTAGCDKTFATCRKRFGNQVNFRGFPLMPGNDWLAQPARSDGDNDGGRRG
ncbi:hypothetical protein GCM10008171_12450 [Methylopila jiangsuensis]|uniref:Bacteriophage phiJL001 Gp84 C-terminal domain-containing protein n=1 Tax=Methylopila jiangsuensis TaxID=586230 RepID=A0A9W6JEA4_9HYPH|nr:DUF2163 domain-containing protein [Methylopila jiangsuensis]MDR6286230.1 putative phage protein (TIGR02218 family) [Methylopila jiangsuensis]GLK75991.1 hypothetical protein GCM10008171_12450 [Methylopila jiangsuensis]